MNSPDIIRVWGTADNIALELKQNNGRWVCNLPPDLVDGQYAIQLFAMRGNGETGMWTGVLYITNGIRCLHLNKEKYTLWLMPELIRIQELMSLNEERISFIAIPEKFKIQILEEKIKINLIEECCHYE